MHLDHEERQLLGLAATEDSVFVGRETVETELEIGLQVLRERLRLVGIPMKKQIVRVEREHDAIVHLE